MRSDKVNTLFSVFASLFIGVYFNETQLTFGKFAKN